LAPRKRIKIGIVFALREETRGLERVFSESRLPSYTQDGHIIWHMGDVEILLSIGGIGRNRCAMATENLIRSGAHCILCAGFATGLDPTIEVGDVIIANKVVAVDGILTDPIHCHIRLISSAPPSGKFGYVIRHGDITTSDVVLSSVSEKTEAYRRTGGAALDMESYSAGEVCSRQGVPFEAIRSISDRADEDLPESIKNLIDIKSSLGQFFFIISKPEMWFPLMRLRSQTRTAADNLGEVLGLMLLRLVRAT